MEKKDKPPVDWEKINAWERSQKEGNKMKNRKLINFLKSEKLQYKFFITKLVVEMPCELGLFFRRKMEGFGYKLIESNNDEIIGTLCFSNKDTSYCVFKKGGN